ncbi:MAG: hypothetical protein R3266_04650, partial [Gemmatimonadota bacterium]|nr:hypothetical protein [Gemmatimonadota bacterium]
MSRESRGGDGTSERGDPAGAALLADAGRRILGLLLIALVAVPVFQILDPEAFNERLMRSAGTEHWAFTWGLQGGVWT